VSVFNSTHGSATLADTVMTFVPDANSDCAGTFEYAVRDPAGAVDTALVVVEIIPDNDPPLPQPDNVTTQAGHPLTIEACALLANDSDPDSACALAGVACSTAPPTFVSLCLPGCDTLRIASVRALNVTHGTVALGGNTVLYTPAAGFVGAAQFEYSVDDGHGGLGSGLVFVNVLSGPPANCHESRGLEFWRPQCPRHGSGERDEKDGDRGYSRGQGSRGDGDGHENEKGHGVSPDSLSALVACVAGSSRTFGIGGCFTADCDLLQGRDHQPERGHRAGVQRPREKLGRYFLVLLLNRCAGLVCDSQLVQCEGDGDCRDCDDHGNDHGHQRRAGLIKPSTVGEIVAFVDQHLCAGGGTETSLGELQELVECALRSGRGDHDEREDGDHNGDRADASERERPHEVEDLGTTRQSGFAVLGTMPSPSNGTIAIRFTLPSSGDVRVEMLDVAGRRVATRDMGMLGAGEHVAVAGDADLPPGVYLVRLTWAAWTLSSRVVVAR
jgi:hypothetical protein